MEAHSTRFPMKHEIAVKRLNEWGWEKGTEYSSCISATKPPQPSVLLISHFVSPLHAQTTPPLEGDIVIPSTRHQSTPSFRHTPDSSALFHHRYWGQHSTSTHTWSIYRTKPRRFQINKVALITGDFAPVSFLYIKHINSVNSQIPSQHQRQKFQILTILWIQSTNFTKMWHILVYIIRKIETKGTGSLLQRSYIKQAWLILWLRNDVTSLHYRASN